MQHTSQSTASCAISAPNPKKNKKREMNSAKLQKISGQCAA
jgi:hypothetical protein